MREGLAHDVEIVGEEGRDSRSRLSHARSSPTRSCSPTRAKAAGDFASASGSRCPTAKVILWQESQMGVMDPGAGTIRWVPAGGLPDLLAELVASYPMQLKE